MFHDVQIGLYGTTTSSSIAEGVVHDYRNRLQAIKSALELIKDRAVKGQSSDIISLANAAQTLLNGVGEVTGNLQGTICPSVWEAEPVEINDFLAGLESVLRSLCRKVIALEVIYADRPVTVMCSPRQLENALINLVMNACDAVSGEGIVTVTATSAAPFLVDRGETWPLAAISVSDSGCGMCPETIRRATKPSFTTKGSGRGLGLTMVQLFAEQAGGAMKIRSKVGRGTTISLLLRDALPVSFVSARSFAPSVPLGA